MGPGFQLGLWKREIIDQVRGSNAVDDERCLRNELVSSSAVFDGYACVVECEDDGDGGHSYGWGSSGEDGGGEQTAASKPYRAPAASLANFRPNHDTTNQPPGAWRLAVSTLSTIYHSYN
jgi:hypothetical protein